MNPMLTMIGVFVAVATAVLIGLSLFAELFLKNKLRVHQRIDEEFRGKVRKRRQITLLAQLHDAFDLMARADCMDLLVISLEGGLSLSAAPTRRASTTGSRRD